MSNPCPFCNTGVSVLPHPSGGFVVRVNYVGSTKPHSFGTAHYIALRYWRMFGGSAPYALHNC